MLKKIFIILAINTFLFGCVANEKKEVEISSKSLIPKSKPLYNRTNINSALKCIDNQLSKNSIKKIRIYVDSRFPDLGAAGVRSTRDMIITALIKLSTKSGKVGAVMYTQGSDLDALWTEGMNASSSTYGSATYSFPQYFLRGSITQAEKAHSSGGESKGFSLGVPNVELGAREAVKISVSSVGLDLHLGRFGSMELIHFSSNMLSIKEKNDSAEVYLGLIEKVDFDYGVDFSQREGMSSAVRTLVEYGVIEIIGKLLNLEYEQCLNPRRLENNNLVLTKQVQKSPVIKLETATIDLSSDRGTNPVYKKGEIINLTVIPSKAMYLYCFYIDNHKHEVTQLFPNTFSPQSHRSSNEHLTLPSPEMPFQIEAGNAGSDIFSCYGTSKDIGTDLTQKLGKNALEAMSNLSLISLKKTIKDLSGGKMVHKQINITVK